MTRCPTGQPKPQQDRALQILIASLYECKWKDDKNVGFCLSLQGSKAEPLPLSFLQNIPFGLIGLGFAVLDFTGASRKLEAMLARYVAYERQYAQEARGTLLTRDFQYHRREFVSFLPVLALSVLILGLGWWIQRDGEVGQWLTSVFTSAPIWLVVGFAFSAVFIAYVLNHILSQSFSYLVSIILWCPLWLLSQPKAGIIGSIGLIIAVLDNFVA